MAEFKVVIPLRDNSASIELDSNSLPEDTLDLSEILALECAEPRLWVQCANEYFRQGKLSQSIDFLQQGINSVSAKDVEGKCSMYATLCSMLLEKYREADSDTATNLKSQIASTISDLRRTDPKYQYLDLLNGVWAILSADSLQSLISQASTHLHLHRSVSAAAASLSNSQVWSMATIIENLGCARVLVAKKDFKAALKLYQKVLLQRPKMTSPDPRIGIAICLCELNHTEDAKLALNRALELAPTDIAKSEIYSLIALINYNKAFDDILSSTFANLYAESLENAQKSFKLNQKNPVANLLLAGYMYSKKNYPSALKLLERAIENSQKAPQLLSMCHNWLGRTHHALDDLESALLHFRKAQQYNDQNTYCQLGIAQVQVLQNDELNAKLTLERLLEKSPKCVEAIAMLASLYFIEGTSNISNSSSLENHSLNTARTLLDKIYTLVDSTHEIFRIPSIRYMKAVLSEKDDLSVVLSEYNKLLELINQKESPEKFRYIAHIYNNIGVVSQMRGNLDVALQSYTDALKYTGEIDPSETPEVQSLKEASSVTINFNIARCYEQLGQDDKATEAYNAILETHPGYSDALVRKCTMELAHPTKETFKAIRNLIETDSGNPEVRAFFGWYLGKQKKRSLAPNQQDPEQKHCEQTLRHWKDDCYAFVQLGNVLLRQAREIHDNDAKRHKLYTKALQLFDQALKLEPRNAYAAQGVAIVLAYQKQYKPAMHIFSKLRETLQDASTMINLAHVLTELGHYSRAIEVYEQTLNSNKLSSTQKYTIYTILGRVWFLKEKAQHNILSLKKALKYTEMALEGDPKSGVLLFNCAYVKFQQAEIIRGLQEDQRTIQDIEDAQQNLTSAIDILTGLQSNPSTPYQAEDLVQRVKQLTTLQRQLERTLQSQKEYESENIAKITRLKKVREEERQKMLEEESKREAVELERQRLLAEERRKIAEELSGIRSQREQQTTGIDEEDPKPKKRKKSHSNKIEDDSDDSEDNNESSEINRSSRKANAISDDDEDEEQVSNHENNHIATDNQSEMDDLFSDELSEEETVEKNKTVTEE